MSSERISPDHYSILLENKVERFTQQLTRLNSAYADLPLAVFDSPKTHFRMRAEFKIWHQGDTAHYAMTDPVSKKPVLIDEFPIATKTINRLMPRILSAINHSDILRKKLFQIEFLSTLKGECLISLIYHKPLNDTWKTAAASLKQQLNMAIIGRSRKQKIVLGQDFVTETLQVGDRRFHYKQIEGSFTQPNARVCEKMLLWAVTQSRNIGGDLLELYCGNGNFTLPLATNFRRVLATEIAKTSVKAAIDNIAANHQQNITLLRLSSEEFTQALDKVRPFRRLAHIDLDDYDFSTVFVDPPRAGLDAATLHMLQRFKVIIYLSCNPETLLSNLATLCQTHQLKNIAVFDQFPYTPHLETGVILQKTAITQPATTNSDDH
ncbi:MAG: tRNA (uridine(54)-C5)-methyltransferase TrmA [Cellvibrionaceae bacterium]|nr:tRNA (uridine(54)-C5)-methyltransferase TrmA [Cellvibrionaceae bacterium]